VFEPLQVQLQLLTAIVKLFLKRPTDTQELVQQVLSLATQVGLFFYISNNKTDKKEERISDDMDLHLFLF
jgi:hypothetical protein